MGVYKLKNPKVDEVEYIISCCVEHVVKLLWWSDEPTLYITFHLSTRGFFHRFWLGLKYIFGYKSQYGQFGDVVLDENDVMELALALREFQGGEL